MKRRAATGLLIAILSYIFLLTTGCGNSPREQTPPPLGGYSVTDSHGYVAKLAHKPQRLVSLTIGTDEMLTGLVPAERIAALTYLADDSSISNISETAKQVPGKIRANAESVVAMSPDLVITADWQAIELIQSIRDVGIAVYVYKTPNNIAEVKQVISELAHVVGEEAAGARIIADMEAELLATGRIIEQVPPDKRQVVVNYSLMGGMGGKGSMFEDLCRYAGVIDGAASVGLNKDGLLAKEQIIKINPDILLTPDWDYTGKTDFKQFATDLENDLALRQIKAIANKKLVQIPDRYVYSTSQYIVYGVSRMAKAAYPQYF
ncbi:ABC transporter substrate-binding protein [Sporomusa termitida]|uniref:Putative ABC transporter PGF-CTERM-modified substrate-binding protein n=1 Tax=Sporomusa termitida TaxID=2377 RepID=A0A517DP26_9FIRM|nr:ABC transporter substrate-binding protein [Sporomusa termitida]QDR79111.1 putative ABC transporter PGF-CTERM-modified substrate-binding protein [Sporomusa termitida]